VSHANAALTPRPRLRLACLVVEQGWTHPAAATMFLCSPRTAGTWADRCRVEGPAGMVDRSSLLPVSVLDGALERGRGQDVTLTVEGETVTVDGASTRSLGLATPDYRRLLHERPTGVAVSGTALVSDLSRVEADVATINRHDGVITVGAREGLNVGVNPEFLLQALAAAGDGQLDLALDGPIAPLLVRSEDRGRATLLMPVAP
jgi:hypothetical protein